MKRDDEQRSGYLLLRADSDPALPRAVSRYLPADHASRVDKNLVCDIATTINVIIFNRRSFPSLSIGNKVFRFEIYEVTTSL